MLEYLSSIINKPKSIFFSLLFTIYKNIIMFYCYIVSFNSKIKYYKNNTRYLSLNKTQLENDEQMIIKLGDKKYSLIKKEYNDIDDILAKFDINKKEIGISKILIIKEIEHTSNIDYTNDEILKYIIMNYGPNNDLYGYEYKIKLGDILDDKDNPLSITKLTYTDNNLNEITLTGDEYLI